jgi:hypothetical protein
MFSARRIYPQRSDGSFVISYISKFFLVVLKLAVNTSTCQKRRHKSIKYTLSSYIKINHLIPDVMGLSVLPSFVVNINGSSQYPLLCLCSLRHPQSFFLSGFMAPPIKAPMARATRGIFTGFENITPNNLVAFLLNVFSG